MSTYNDTVSRLQPLGLGLYKLVSHKGEDIWNVYPVTDKGLEILLKQGKDKLVYPVFPSLQEIEQWLDSKHRQGHF